MHLTCTSPKLKRTCWIAVEIYAAACTLVVTLCLGLFAWCALFGKQPSGPSQRDLFLTSYSGYLSAEYPAKGARFRSMAEALCEYVAESGISEAELFRYLGTPKQFFVTNVTANEPGQRPVTNKIVLYAYHFEGINTGDKWSATALVDRGGVEQVTLTDASQRLAFQPFQAGAAPNPQGANGRQPFSSETNRTPAAAASRRSP
jgi:hypothetical protein